MVPEDEFDRIRLLISDFKERAGPKVISPSEVCRYVSLHLGISETSAREMIVRAALRDAELTRRGA